MTEVFIKKWSRVYTIDKLIIIGMIIAAYLLKPMVLGGNFTPISMGIMLFLVLLYLLRNKVSIYIPKKIIIIMFNIIIYYFYLIIQSLVLVGSIRADMIKALISIVVIVLCYGILFENKIIRYYFFKIYISTLIFFVISYFITFILSFIMSNETLLLKRIYTKRYNHIIDIYLPITISTGRILVMGHLLPRLSALLRECGIAQIFYIWAFIVCDQYFVRVKLVKVLLICGIIFCFSTTGYINIIIVAALLLMFYVKDFKKLIGYLLIFIIMVWGFSNIPGIRMADKNEVSYDARIEMLEVGIKELKKNIVFGSGYSNRYIEGSSTTFLQKSYSMGIVGVILYLNIYLVAFINSKNKRRYILGITALLSTILFSQPIDEAPLIFLLLLHDYNLNYIEEGKN